MERIVNLEGKEFGIKASAGTVRAYRDAFASDLIIDMGTIEAEILGSKTLGAESTKVAENAIYIMAKEYDRDIPPINEWLEQFSPYFIYLAIPEVISMWALNTQTLNNSKKNRKKQTATGQQHSSS